MQLLRRKLLILPSSRKQSKRVLSLWRKLASRSSWPKSMFSRSIKIYWTNKRTLFLWILYVKLHASTLLCYNLNLTLIAYKRSCKELHKLGKRHQNLKWLLQLLATPLKQEYHYRKLPTCKLRLIKRCLCLKYRILFSQLAVQDSSRM